MISAVVIVNWNSGERLKGCLDSLPSGSDVVVVDNASEDDSLELAGRSGVQARVIRNDSNRGLAAALNQGFQSTSTSYVLVLNPDVRVQPGAIEALEQTLDAHPEAGAVGGYVNEKYLPRRLATPWTVVRENCGFPVAAVSAAEVGQAAAAALLVRREAYIKVGGFDERFVPAWYEDVDFCAGLHRAGWKVRFVRSAEFVHEGGYSARTLGASGFAAAYYHNQLRYILKHFGRAAGLAVRLSIAAGMTARALVGQANPGACSKVIAGALGGW